jgi:hypothetical protein
MPARDIKILSMLSDPWTQDTHQTQQFKNESERRDARF